VRVVEAETRHLSPDEGVVAAVEIEQAPHVPVAAVADVGLDEGLRVVGVAVVVEVHGKEGRLGRHVAVTEALVELDAVEDDDPVGQADVLGVEVAVAVPDPVFLHALLEQLPLPIQVPIHPGLEEIVPAAGEGDPDVRCRLLEVLVVIAPDRFDAAALVDLAARIRGGVECGDLPGDGIHGPPGDLPFGQQPLQHPLPRKPLHHDGIIDGPAGPEPNLARLVLADRGDLQIGLGRQPAVEPQLLPAVVHSLFERREIEKAEADGLLHLVHPVPCDEDEGDVRLDELHRLGSVRVEPGPQHRFHKAGVRHGIGFLSGWPPGPFEVKCAGSRVLSTTSCRRGAGKKRIGVVPIL